MRLVLFLLAFVLAPWAQAQSLDDLAWLKGCWRTSGDGPEITEVWVAPPGPAMFGYSFTRDRSAITGWEQTRIEMIDGVLTFIAMPNGSAPVRFPHGETDRLLWGLPDGGDAITFINEAHDFPQVVSYGRVGDRLTAEISDSEGGQRVTFEYQRIRCPAELRP